MVPPPPREEPPPDGRIEPLPEDIPPERMIELPPEERTEELLLVRILELLLEELPARVEDVLEERFTEGAETDREEVDTEDDLFTVDVERTGVAASFERRVAEDTELLRDEVFPVLRVVTVCERVAVLLRSVEEAPTRDALLRLEAEVSIRLFVRTFVLPKVLLDVLREDTRVSGAAPADGLRIVLAPRTAA